MRRMTFIIGILLAATPASAQELHPVDSENRMHMSHASPSGDQQHPPGMPSQVTGTRFDRATEPANLEYEPYSMPQMGPDVFTLLLFEQLEYSVNDGADTFRWDMQGYIGGDYNKLWIKSEGEQQVSGDKAGEGEFQALYSRLIAPFWDFQVGVRYEQLWGPGSDPSRFSGVIGVQGLSPYRFEVEPTLFISEDGDISARLTAATDLLITQRLILEPRFETEVAIQEVEKFGVGQGFNYVELGLRLRYEIRREFAPYVGINWLRKLGETADMARREGEDIDDFGVVFGVRLWF